MAPGSAPQTPVAAALLWAGNCMEESGRDGRSPPRRLGRHRPGDYAITIAGPWKEHVLKRYGALHALLPGTDRRPRMCIQPLVPAGNMSSHGSPGEESIRHSWPGCSPQRNGLRAWPTLHSFERVSQAVTLIADTTSADRLRCDSGRGHRRRQDDRAIHRLRIRRICRQRHRDPAGWLSAVPATKVKETNHKLDLIV
jgi:hypothetical protein